MIILVTGGAGFIGANIVETLLQNADVAQVRVIDNLSTGHLNNIKQFQAHSKFKFIAADIADYEQTLAAVQGATHISHQAALGSVPRSIANPIATNTANIVGTLNILTAAKECGVQRVVYAASSSTYGDSPNLPKVEHIIGKPLSPYAVTKYVMELYAEVFSKLYGLETIGLRYFNVFGQYQNPNGAYAAVIPLFVAHAIAGTPPTINGDGSVSRDFTYVQNVVDANIKALFTTNKEALNQVYNIAYGGSTTLLELYNMIQSFAGTALAPNFGPTRPGDIQHSLADIGKAQDLLGYAPQVSVQKGLAVAFDWYKANPKYFVS